METPLFLPERECIESNTVNTTQPFWVWFPIPHSLEKWMSVHYPVGWIGKYVPSDLEFSFSRDFAHLLVLGGGQIHPSSRQCISIVLHFSPDQSLLIKQNEACNFLLAILHLTHNTVDSFHFAQHKQNNIIRHGETNKSCNNSQVDYN